MLRKKYLIQGTEHRVEEPRLAIEHGIAQDRNGVSGDDIVTIGRSIGNTARRNGDNGGEGSVFWIGFRHARTSLEVSSFVGI